MNLTARISRLESNIKAAESGRGRVARVDRKLYQFLEGTVGPKDSEEVYYDLFSLPSNWKETTWDIDQVTLVNQSLASRGVTNLEFKVDFDFYGVLIHNLKGETWWSRYGEAVVAGLKDYVGTIQTEARTQLQEESRSWENLFDNEVDVILNNLTSLDDVEEYTQYDRNISLNTFQVRDCDLRINRGGFFEYKVSGSGTFYFRARNV